MTAVEDSSQPMRPTPDRSRRVLVWWAVGLGLLAVLGLGCWLVAVPALQVHRVASSFQRLDNWFFPGPAQASVAIEDLGGPEAAARKIGLYLRLPVVLTGGMRTNARLNSAALLGYCGKPGLREIRGLLGADAEEQRTTGAWALCVFTVVDCHGQFPSRDVKKDLQHAIETGDPETRRLLLEIVEIFERELKARGVQPMQPK